MLSGAKITSELHKCILIESEDGKVDLKITRKLLNRTHNNDTKNQPISDEERINQSVIRKESGKGDVAVNGLHAGWRLQGDRI